MSKYDAELQERARAMRAAGKFHREIAEALGVSVPTASQWTRGVLPINKQATREKKIEVLPVLKSMYLAGHPISHIAQVTGVPAPTLFDWRRELGLPKSKRTAYVTEEIRRSAHEQFTRDPDGSKAREAVRLYTEEQLSTVEIGERMGLSAGTVGTWLKEQGVELRKAVTLRTREKLRTANLGDKRWNWKGGISGENARARGSFEMRLAREACFQRDDYTCRSCQQRGGKLNAHHVWPFQRFPEWKYEVWNLVTLCKQCHDAFHNRAGGAVKVAIGPFFSTPGGVKEMPAPYEYRIAA